MLRACQYCGRIHDSSFDCGRKPVRAKKRSNTDVFRSSRPWQRKRDDIRGRDRNFCRWCLAQGTLNCADLSVHHIEPLEQAWEMRLEDDNLITLCGRCHELAEAGKIPREDLRVLAQQPPKLSPLVISLKKSGLKTPTPDLKKQNIPETGFDFYGKE